MGSGHSANLRGRHVDGLVHVERKEIHIVDAKNARCHLAAVTIEKRYELYDLSADPGQAHNALAEHPEVVAELAALLESYRALIPDTRPIGWIAR